MAEPSSTPPRDPLPDLHDLSDAEVDAMPRWKRACFAIRSFNFGGLRSITSIQDWADTFFYGDPACAVEEAESLLKLMDRWEAPTFTPSEKQQLSAQWGSSATPRTDAQRKKYQAGNDWAEYCHTIDFARQLERDFNQAEASRAQNANLLDDALQRLNASSASAYRKEELPVKVEGAKYFRKKPIIVSAIQWFKWGDHPAVNRFLGNPRFADDPNQGKPWVDTLEGGHFVIPGDWIIEGVEGEFYPRKPDIFEKTYEPLPEDHVTDRRNTDGL